MMQTHSRARGVTFHRGWSEKYGLHVAESLAVLSASLFAFAWIAESYVANASLNRWDARFNQWLNHEAWPPLVRLFETFTIPGSVVFLVAAIPVVYLLSARKGPPARVAAAGLAGLLLFSIERNARQYFVGFDRQYARMMDHATEMAEILDGYRKRGVPLRQMYLLYTDYWVDGRNIGLELGDPYWADTHIIPTGEVPRGLRERPLVFLHTPGAPVMEELKKTYPGTDRLIPQNFPDRNFSVYFAP